MMTRTFTAKEHNRTFLLSYSEFPKKLVKTAYDEGEYSASVEVTITTGHSVSPNGFPWRVVEYGNNRRECFTKMRQYLSRYALRLYRC